MKNSIAAPMVTRARLGRDGVCRACRVVGTSLVLVVTGVVVAAAEPEFRSIDGNDNNLSHPTWGATGVRLPRMGTAAYGDGSGSPAREGLASARMVSNAVCAQSMLVGNRVGASDMLWQWGQFLDHDLDLTPSMQPTERFDIAVPIGDPFFDTMSEGGKVIALARSFYQMMGDPAVREQINVITSYIDASNVYGSDEARAAFLRADGDSGRLRTSGRRWLPANAEAFDNAPTPFDPRFPLAGDVRASEQLALLAMHTLFLREHNRLAGRDRLLGRVHKSLTGSKPDELTGDLRYQLARVLVGAEMQAITYREFLPVLLGPGAIGPYEGYDPEADATITNEFATAAYRLGHSLLSPIIERRRRDGSPIRFGDLELADAFFVPHKLRNEGGPGPILRGLAWHEAQELDVMVVDAVRNFLFGLPGEGGFDLAALNIQRGRDHGLPGYNDLREAMGMDRAATFADISSDVEVQTRLASVYAGPDEVDPWVGMLAEDRVGMGLVGELQMSFMTDQFAKLRSGDRFWYQRILSRGMQRWVHRRTLARIIRAQTGVRNELQDNVFLVP